MNNRPLWHGVYPALLTPFQEDGKIDFSMFKKNLATQIEAGIAGVIIAGTLGEQSTLEDEEKYELTAFAKKNVPEGFPVIVNLAERTTQDAIKFAKKSAEIGADGLMLLPPMRYRASDREVVSYFQAVAKSTSLPILIYNNPVDYGIKVTLDMFEQLVDYPTVQAVKESTRDLTNITRMINRFGDRFKILCGVDTITLEAQLMGVHGTVAGLVDAFPRETVAVFNLARAGRIEEALKIYRWFMPLLELDITPRLVQYIKLAAATEGISNEYVRAPRLPLTKEEKERVQKIIDDAIATRPELPEYLSLTQKEAVV